MGAMIFHNSGALPLSLLQVMAEDATDHRAHPLADESALGRAMMHVSLLGSCFLILLFTVGTLVLSSLNTLAAKDTTHRSVLEVLLGNKSTKAILIGLVVA